VTPVQVENITLTFNETVDPFQYEAGGACVAGWPNGSKVVDVVATEVSNPPSNVWLVEVKDFRIITSPPRPSNLSGLAATVEAKVRQTLSSLPLVTHASQDLRVQTHASNAAAAQRARVVLHLEPHPSAGSHASLFPSGFTVNVLLQLRILLADIDPNPLVLNIARTANASVPWSAA
jgi:hypothetical protein